MVYSSLLYFLLVIHGSCARMKTRGLAVGPTDYEDYGDVWNPLRGGLFSYVFFMKPIKSVFIIAMSPGVDVIPLGP